MSIVDIEMEALNVTKQEQEHIDLVLCVRRPCSWLCGLGKNGTITLAQGDEGHSGFIYAESMISLTWTRKHAYPNQGIRGVVISSTWRIIILDTLRKGE